MKNLEKITSGADHQGELCVVCQEKIVQEDEVVVCPRCRSIHHGDCWKAKGGCGKSGCAQVAQAVVGERPQGDGPPPPPSKWVIFGSIAAVLGLILASIFWPKPPDPAMGRTKITFLGEAYYDLNEEMSALAEQYNETSEDIYIDLQLLPPGSVDQKLIVLIAAGDAPDVIALADGRLEYFLEHGTLLQLGEDENGEPIYTVQHPGQLAQLIVWGETNHPEEAKEVLYYFAERITPVDLDLLRELDITPAPLFGF